MSSYWSEGLVLPLSPTDVRTLDCQQRLVLSAIHWGQGQGDGDQEPGAPPGAALACWAQEGLCVAACSGGRLPSLPFLEQEETRWGQGSVNVLTLCAEHCSCVCEGAHFSEEKFHGFYLFVSISV